MFKEKQLLILKHFQDQPVYKMHLIRKIKAKRLFFLIHTNKPQQNNFAMCLGIEHKKQSLTKAATFNYIKVMTFHFIDISKLKKKHFSKLVVEHL